MDRQLEELLKEARQVPRLSDLVRARVLARARASLAADTTLTVVAPRHVQTRGSRLAIAFAAAVAAAAGGATVGAFAALGVRAPRIVETEPAPPSGPVLRSRPTKGNGTKSSGVTNESVPAASARRPRSLTSAHDALSAELDLLRRAQGAYARNDFANALALVSEHQRQFPNARLAEEREALRAWSLSGAGRRPEARRAAQSFTVRFPHSVLVPSLRELAEATE